MESLDRPKNRSAAKADGTSVRAALERAIALSRRRRWREAEILFRRILKARPDHFDTLHLLGCLYLQAGKLDRGVAALERAVEIRPDSAGAHFNLGNALSGRREWERAAAAYRRAVDIDPDRAAAHNRLGMALANQGRLDAAAECYRRAVDAAPGAADAHNNLGNLLRHQRRFEEAAGCYRRVIDIDPGYEAAHNNLGMALRGAGHGEAAAACFRRAIEINPRFAPAHNNLGIAFRDGGQADEAIASYRRAVAVDSGFAEAHNNLGIALEGRGRTDEAIAAYRAAIAADPGYAAAHNNLGNLLRDKEDLDEAVAAFRRAIALSPDLAVAHNNLGIALRNQEKIEDAAASYRRAIDLDPGYAEAHNNLGNLLKDRGEKDEALAAYDRAIDLNPDFAEAHFNRAKLHTFYPGDPALARLKAFLAQDAVPEEHRSSLLYSLGKAHDESGLYDEAFEFYRQANDEKGKTLAFDPDTHRRGRIEVIDVFREPRPAPPAAPPDARPTPVFVVGMSRSGKTMVESLLAQHPDVHAAGETHLWTESMTKVLVPGAVTEPYPRCMVTLGEDRIAEIGRRYLDAISELAPEARFTVDTMPANYPYVGLILEALPSAKIVVCRRHPLDHCLFVYFYSYRTGNAYAYDLAQTGSYYADYHRLLDHWQGLYGGRLHAVRYEDLVRAPQDAAAAVYGHCGLDCDPAAIDAPFTDGEIGHWKRYERHLGPLTEALERWYGDDADPAPGGETG